MAGVYFRAFPNPKEFEQWADGHKEGQLWMKDIRERLSEDLLYKRFEASGNDSLLSKSGWVNELYARLSGFSHGRPFYVDQYDNKVPTTNVGLWGGSNGPVYEPRSVRLWSAYYFDVGLLCLLLVGLAEEKLLQIPKPTEISYVVFLEHLINWHFGPRPIAKEIVGYLTRQ